MIKHLIFFSLVFIFTATVSCQSDTNTENNNDIPKRKVELNYFETNVGWGYEVIINGKSYITQKHLPCECGGEGFKSKEKASLAAEFLKQKIENNERNLLINKMQLDSLGAL